MSDQFAAGYRGQLEWLDQNVADMDVGERRSFLKSCLAARHATLEPSAYNQGGDAAVADMLQELAKQ